MSHETSESLERQRCLAENFSRYRVQLRRSIAGRMGAKMQQRVDPSDILQEAYLVASQKIEKSTEPPTVSFFVWMKTICHQTFSAVFEKHFKSQKRSATREERLAESFGLSQFAVDHATSPSAQLVKKEEKEGLLELIASMKPNDRQILFLRMIEQLSTEEAAQRLGISVAAAKKRHIRAFRRLVEACQTLAPNGEESAHSEYSVPSAVA